MSRWKAAAIHFGASLIVLLTLASALAATWYPPELVQAVGGLGLMALLAGVDACLGPLLTAIVFKSGKPGLTFDLTVIALLQLLALSYGIHTVYLARPVYVVFAKDRFEVLTAADIPPENLGKTNREEFRSLPLTGPKFVSARRPENNEESQKILFSALFGGADLSAFPQYYVPYGEETALVVEKSRPLGELLEKNESNHRILADYLKNHGLPESRIKYLPLQAKKRDQVALIDGISAKVVGIVDIDPW